MTMKHRPFLRLAAALLIAVFLSLYIASPALALDLNPADYFQISYEPVSFDKSEVTAGEVFHAFLKGRAACFKDLPLPVTEAIITSQVVARPAAGGADLILNPEYVIDINPVPRQAGEFFDINQSVTLQFPAGAAPGSYGVIGKLSRAEVTIKVLISYTQDITGSFPKEQEMGAVKCVLRTPAPPAASPTTIAATTQPASAAAPVTNTVSSSTPPRTPYPQPPPEATNPLTLPVMVLCVAVAALVIVVVVLIRRHRVS